MKVLSKAILAVAVMASVAIVPSYAAHATTPTCVDGTIKSNLSATLVDRNTVTVGTKDQKPLCDDVTLYFSSYSLPSTYNGEKFKDNPTAIPQSLFHTTVVTLPKGMTETKTVTVTTPEACKPTQVDLYYGPEVTAIDATHNI